MKVYKSKLRTYTFSVNVDGESVRVRFEDKREPYFYGVYYCTDEKVAKAIESHPQFGKTIELLSDDTPAKKEESAIKFAAVYEDVKRTQEANKILVNEYGVDKDKLASKADAIRFASELNISFPNL